MSMAPLFTILRNGETVQTLPLDGEASIGRDKDCLIHLDDRAISRRHALLKKTLEGVEIQKQSEFAPISVNGAECTSAILKEGDIVSIGPYLLRLSMKAEVAPAPSAAAPVNAVSPAPPASLPTRSVSENLPPIEDSAVFSTQESKNIIPEEPKEEKTSLNSSFESSLDDSFNPSAQNSGILEFKENNSENLGAIGTLSLEPVSDGMGSSDPIVQEIAPAEIMADEHAATEVRPIPMHAKLTLAPGAANVQEFPLNKDEIFIGRGRDCDIVLNDKKASRKNALLKREGSVYVIKDLESANGTYINHNRVTEQLLAGGDVIRVGDTEIVFEAVQANYDEKEKDFIVIPDEVPGAQADEQPAEALITDLDEFVRSTPPVGAPMLQDGGQIPGITSEADLAPAPKQSLYVRYIRNFGQLRPIQKVLVVLVLFFVGSILMEEEKQVAKRKPASQAKKDVAGTRTFENLTPEQQKFVKTQRDIAFEYYKNRDFDQAIVEIEKVFKYVDDYLNSKEILEYSKEGKRRLENAREEAKRKELLEANRRRVAQLVEEIRALMDKKAYEQASALFPEILERDPDNKDVENWKRIIDSYYEAQRLEAQQKQVQEEINRRAWDVYNEGIALKRAGKYHSAMGVLEKVSEIGASDKSVISKAQAAIKACRSLIADAREPYLAKARELEDAGDMLGAYQNYKGATKVDPPHPAGHAGMARVKGFLHDRAKNLYTEAVIAESYSDFTTAQKKFKECLSTAPDDDIYHDRAKRKLANYFKFESRGLSSE